LRSSGAARVVSHSHNGKHFAQLAGAGGNHEPLLKRSPSGMNPRGVFPEVMASYGTFKSCSGLFRNASGNEIAGVDDRKALGIVTALEIKRLVLGGVDLHRLLWV
jgi:hypothetical protein